MLQLNATQIAKAHKYNFANANCYVQSYCHSALYYNSKITFSKSAILRNAKCKIANDEQYITAYVAQYYYNNYANVFPNFNYAYSIKITKKRVIVSFYDY